MAMPPRSMAERFFNAPDSLSVAHGR